MNYNEKLNKAYGEVDEIEEKSERFQVPTPKITEDGSDTIYSNVITTAQSINRSKSELITFLKEELATNATLEARKLKLSGEFSDKDIKDAVDRFVEMYVLCSECESPDTKYDDSGKESIKCTACGAVSDKPNHG